MSKRTKDFEGHGERFIGMFFEEQINLCTLLEPFVGETDTSQGLLTYDSQLSRHQLQVTVSLKVLDSPRRLVDQGL